MSILERLSSACGDPSEASNKDVAAEALDTDGHDADAGIGDQEADPPIKPRIPVGKSTWWAGVKSGRFPQPVKVSPRITNKCS